MHEVVKIDNISKLMNSEPVSYEEIVQDAKKLYARTILYKLKIAKLAVRVCKIRHGGKSDKYYTMKDFSRDTGIPYKALSDWTMTYRLVCSHLGDKIKTDNDWQKASLVCHELQKIRAIEKKQSGKERSKSPLGIDKKTVMQTWDKIENQNTDIMKAHSNIKTAHFNIKNAKITDKQDRTYLFDINSEISEMSKLLEVINEKVMELLQETNKCSI